MADASATSVARISHSKLARLHAAAADGSAIVALSPGKVR
ncbi:MAG: hypothetical protein JWN21_1659 [Sphingomonas bacterium]|nr:hypothetical protein [Sphingomonas bacterium]